MKPPAQAAPATTVQRTRTFWYNPKPKHGLAGTGGVHTFTFHTVTDPIGIVGGSANKAGKSRKQHKPSARKLSKVSKRLPNGSRRLQRRLASGSRRPRRRWASGSRRPRRR